MFQPKLTERKHNLTEPTHGIYVDFWEGYDSESIHQNGFFLIGSEMFPMPSVCFLCGSAGKESIIFCSLCCESYHRFCLKEAKSTLLNLHRNCKQYCWICPKCVSCDKCNQMDRQKVMCQKCLKSFHSECQNFKMDRENKQLVSLQFFIYIVKISGNCIYIFQGKKYGKNCSLFFLYS